LHLTIGIHILYYRDMSDIDPIQKAKNRLSELDSVIASAQAEKEEFSQFLATYKKLQTPFNGVSHKSTSKKSKGEIAVESAIELYKEGVPVKTSAIYELMEKKGCVIDSKNPIPVVSSYLNKSDVLESIRGKGWIVKG